jgi:hypothetical protein
MNNFNQKTFQVEIPGYDTQLRALIRLEELRKEFDTHVEPAKEYLKYLSEHINSAISSFKKGKIEAGSDLAALESILERDIREYGVDIRNISERDLKDYGVDVSGPKVSTLVEEINSLLEKLSKKNEGLKILKKGGGLLDELIGTAVLLFIPSMIVGWIVVKFMKLLHINLSFWFTALLLLGLSTIYLTIIYPKQKRERLEYEIADLSNQIETLLTQLENRINHLYSVFFKQVSIRLKSWFEGWKSQVNELRQEMGLFGAGWESWKNFEPIKRPLAVLRVGEWTKTIDIPGILQETVSLPALVPFIGNSGLLFVGSGAKREEIIKGIQSLCFRLLTSIPPGKLRFTFIDPVGLGNNVAPLLHLREFDESEEDSLVTSRAWVEAEHIRKQLLAIKEHIAIVIQERLRDQYEDIEEYNREAGEVAVPYRVLVVFDFPANFSTESAQALLSIAQTGKRAGVFTIVHYDPSHKLPYDFKIEELFRALHMVEYKELLWGREKEEKIIKREKENPHAEKMKNMTDAEKMEYIRKLAYEWKREQEEEKKRKEKEAKLKEAWKIYEEIRKNREK